MHILTGIDAQVTESTSRLEKSVSLRQIHVFISHAWSHSTHYETLASWIFDEPWSIGQASLKFRNFSVPRSDPIHNAHSDRELKKRIYNQLSRAHVVVIPTGMYATYSKWIGKEIKGAQFYSKPILAVKPLGQERASSVVGANASKSVGWSKRTVVEGIWTLYRDA
ncbi:MAG: TIR domain-containing protein [Pseudomonadota bacterium]